jgi:pSer/pThr/pTyr-binding forkhead associated (FHA) protein
VLDDDELISRVHASLEDYGAGWCLKDLGSRNGTYVNGERLLGERVLKHGDEVHIGNARLRFNAGRRDEVAATLGSRGRSPVLTRREREVLVALCRPLFTGDVVLEPASTRQIARELNVTEDAVKHHLVNLYDKFMVDDSDSNRRARLAREALLRGAVSRADAM